jgi:hypothetical protein
MTLEIRSHLLLPTVLRVVDASREGGSKPPYPRKQRVPYAPVSHPFVERLIGTIRREYLDRVFFWNAVDLARKLGEFRDYYTRIASTVRSMARPPRNALAHRPLLQPRLIVTLGGSTVAVCFRFRLPLD